MPVRLKRIKDRQYLSGIIILLALLFGFSGGAHALDQLPRHVWLKNLRQGMSYESYYALKDGKIWVKPNESTTGVKGEWKLFEGTGAPFGKEAASFKPDDGIAAFSTDGTMIVAVAKNGRLYFWQPTLEKNTVWADEIGDPFADALYLPPNKTWSFAFSILRAPWKRLAPMHDVVSYWEDIDGNKTQFGLTATIYVVDPTGQKIFFTDTGLPATFNRAFTSPDRGRFIIENMSTAASTILVVNETGKMYTKMMDAEIEGGGPALMFTYARGKRTQGDEAVPIMDAMRSLPLPDWREQEPIAQVRDDLTGRAAITRNITIIQTGEGNAARELRVQGRNRDGQYGYYYKKIFEPSWRFKVTGEPFDAETAVNRYLQEAPRGAKLDKTYAGVLRQAESPPLQIELMDFYTFSSPATLRAHVNGKHFDMQFHTVDQWGPFAQEKGHPELVGNPAGEPKLLQGSLVIPDQALRSTDPDIKKAVDCYFRRFNRIAFAFSVRADDEKVYIQSKVIQRASLSYMGYDFRKRVILNLVNTDPGWIIAPDAVFTALARKAALDVPPDGRVRGKILDLPKRQRLLKSNEDALRDMRYANLRNKLRYAGCGLTALVGAGVYYIFDAFVNLIGFPSYPHWISDPYINEEQSEFAGLSYTGGDALLDHAWLNWMLAFKDDPDYRKARDLIRRRIALLKRLEQNPAGR